MTPLVCYKQEQEHTNLLYLYGYTLANTICVEHNQVSKLFISGYLFIYLYIYLFIYLFASDTHNLEYMYPYQLLVAVVKIKENSVSG